MPELSVQDFAEAHALIERARKLYETLVLVPWGDIDRRRDVWSEIVEIQDRITALLPPATNPL